LTFSTIARRFVLGLALWWAGVPFLGMDRLRSGWPTTTLALVACNFSGGVVPAVIAMVVVLGYQVYLRVAVRKLTWVVSTCMALGSYVAVRVAMVPSQIGMWEESLGVRIFISSILVAISMIVTCVEMKIRRVKDVLGTELREAAGKEVEKAAKHLRGQ
jgi:hypothetical protein